MLMIAIIGLNLGNAAATRAGGTLPAEPGLTLTLAEVGRNRLILDSRAALRLNGALVPLSGTAAGTGSAGQTVEARAVSQGDGGAGSTPWTDIGTVSAAGAWSGTLAVPRNTRWLRAEARLKANPSVGALGANTFASGHVIALWGQSEEARITLPLYSQTPPVTITDEDAVQVAYFSSPVSFTTAMATVTNAAPITAGIAALAQTLIAARPGEKFAFAFQTVSGTSYGELVSDNADGRSWANDLALHNLLTDNGKTPVGLAMSTWTASTSGSGDNFIDQLMPVFTGRRRDGSVFSVPGVHTFGGTGTIRLDHSFTELYDYTKTRWSLFGPHVFTPDEDMTSATANRAGGGANADLINKQKIRAQIRAFPSEPRATVGGVVGGAPIFIGGGIDIMNYESGVARATAPFWEDWGHPSGVSPDGLELRARFLALEALRAMGFTSWQVPRFDQSVWQADGSYVEVGSGAGPVTTTRIARGEPALPATFPHWTEVFGWQINGQPARRAEIVAGRVRIYPNTAPFTNADVISFGEGGGSGALKVAEDYAAKTWKNYPIVAVPGLGVPGIPVWPVPAATALANTIAGAAFFTSVTPGVFFEDPAAWSPAGAPVSKLTLKAEVAANNLADGPALISAAGNVLLVDITATGTMRLSLRDSSGTNILSAAPSGPTGLVNAAMATIVVSVDLAVPYVRVWVNGTRVFNRDATSTPALVTSTGMIGTGRAVKLLQNTANSKAFLGRVNALTLWKDATPTGSDPAGAPYKTIAGSAAVVNADGWKQGAAAQ